MRGLGMSMPVDAKLMIEPLPHGIIAVAAAWQP